MPMPLTCAWWYACIHQHTLYHHHSSDSQLTAKISFFIAVIIYSRAIVTNNGVALVASSSRPLAV